MRRLTTLISGLAMGVCSTGGLASTDAPALAQPGQPTEPAPAAASADLPDADAVFDRFLEAIGGEEVIRSQTNRVAEGTITSEDGSYFAFLKVWAAEPATLKTRIEEPGKPSVEQFFNGANGWLVSASGEAILLRGNSLRDIAESAKFYAYLEYENTFPQRRTVAEVEWDGKRAYRVDVVSIFGKRPRLYFAKDTGFLIGIETVTAGPEGDRPSSAILRNYQDVGGMLVAREVVQQTEGSVVTVRYTSYEANVEDFPEITMPQRLREIINELERMRREQEQQQQGGGDPERGG